MISIGVIMIYGRILKMMGNKLMHLPIYSTRSSITNTTNTIMEKLTSYIDTHKKKEMKTKNQPNIKMRH